LRRPFEDSKVLEENDQEKGLSTRAMRGSWASSGLNTDTVDENTGTTEAKRDKRKRIIVMNNGGREFEG
jgi:hypothetical protein